MKCISEQFLEIPQVDELYGRAIHWYSSEEIEDWASGLRSGVAESMGTLWEIVLYLLPTLSSGSQKS